MSDKIRIQDGDGSIIDNGINIRNGSTNIRSKRADQSSSAGIPLFTVMESIMFGDFTNDVFIMS